MKYILSLLTPKGPFELRDAETLGKTCLHVASTLDEICAELATELGTELDHSLKEELDDTNSKFDELEEEVGKLRNQVDDLEERNDELLSKLNRITDICNE